VKEKGHTEREWRWRDIKFVLAMGRGLTGCVPGESCGFREEWSILEMLKLGNEKGTSECAQHLR
jgi:hypothetical protein